MSKNYNKRNLNMIIKNLKTNIAKIFLTKIFIIMIKN